MYSKAEFDLLVICSRDVRMVLEKMPLVKSFTNVKFLEVPKSNDLYHALLSKCDIYQYVDVTSYKKVLYLDCDIIVQTDLSQLFKDTHIKSGRIYAPAEGTLTGKYWYLNAYKDTNISRLQSEGVHSFNTGTFMFVPTQSFLKHFRNIKELGETYQGKQHFYDQSFFNYYFNVNNLSSTEYLTDIVQMFPDPEKYYPDKSILHFAGIGRYKEKAKIMKSYLDKLEKIKTPISQS
jgi:lipopolysaccharide biosynthesis glycosyltransferase